MALSIIEGDRVYKGTVSYTGTMVPPFGSIKNSHVSTSADDRIAATKVVHQFPLKYHQAGGTAVVAATVPLHVAMGAGTIVRVDIRPETVPTGGDLAFTVDVKKAADGSVSYASILSAAEEVSVAESSANGTVQSVVPTTTTYSAGDCLQVVIALSGSTGTQGQGVTVVVWVREDPA